MMPSVRSIMRFLKVNAHTNVKTDASIITPKST